MFRWSARSSRGRLDILNNGRGASGPLQLREVTGSRHAPPDGRGLGNHAEVAQLVEQWSEEPCVASSILALGTERFCWGFYPAPFRLCLTELARLADHSNCGLVASASPQLVRRPSHPGPQARLSRRSHGATRRGDRDHQLRDRTPCFCSTSSCRSPSRRYLHRSRPRRGYVTRPVAFYRIEPVSSGAVAVAERTEKPAR